MGSALILCCFGKRKRIDGRSIPGQGCLDQIGFSSGVGALGNWGIWQDFFWRCAVRLPNGNTDRKKR